MPQSRFPLLAAAGPAQQGQRCKLQRRHQLYNLGLRRRRQTRHQDLLLRALPASRGLRQSGTGGREHKLRVVTRQKCQKGLHRRGRSRCTATPPASTGRVAAPDRRCGSESTSLKTKRSRKHKQLWRVHVHAKVGSTNLSWHLNLTCTCPVLRSRTPAATLWSSPNLFRVTLA